MEPGPRIFPYHVARRWLQLAPLQPYKRRPSSGSARTRHAPQALGPVARDWVLCASREGAGGARQASLALARHAQMPVVVLVVLVAVALVAVGREVARLARASFVASIKDGDV